MKKIRINWFGVLVYGIVLTMASFIVCHTYFLFNYDVTQPTSIMIMEDKQTDSDDTMATEPPITAYDEHGNEVLTTASEFEERDDLLLLTEAIFVGECKITYYCCERYEHICNAGSPYKTYCGNDVVPNKTCAVDPDVIPLGAEVYIEFEDGTVEKWLADDTGGSIKGNDVDCAVEFHNEALENGVRYGVVYYVYKG